MPIIVPIEDNKVGLATATDAKFRAPDYSGSGLEALGAGAVQLGAGLEERRRRAAEAIAAAMLDDRHQGNIDDAAVKKAYVDYSDLTHDALHGDDGLFNRQGADAHAAFPGAVEKLVDNHDSALSKLDDVQRAVVAPAMNERLRSDVERAAEHVRQQGAAEQKWRSEQLQEAAARDAVNHADDPDLFDHHLATGEKAIRQQAKIDNVGDDLLAKQIADYKSGVHADTIDALAANDPAAANAWLQANENRMTAADRAVSRSALDARTALTKDLLDTDAHEVHEKDQAINGPDIIDRSKSDLLLADRREGAVETPMRGLLDPQLISSLEEQAKIEEAQPADPAAAKAHDRSPQTTGPRIRPRHLSQAEADRRRFATSRYAELSPADREVMMTESLREQQDIMRAAEARANATTQALKLAEPPAEPGSFTAGQPVLLPNGKGLRDVDTHWGNKYLMSPTADLRPVAGEGRIVGLNFQRMMGNPILADQAYTVLFQSIGMSVGQGGKFDYQRGGGNPVTGYKQLRQFRNVSNFNVGLFMQQTGLFSLDETLRVAGTFAKLLSSNSRSNTTYHLDERTEKWIRIGYRVGESRLYGSATRGTFRAF